MTGRWEYQEILYSYDPKEVTWLPAGWEPVRINGRGLIVRRRITRYRRFKNWLVGVLS